VLYMTTIGATVIGTVGGGSGTLGAGAAVLVVLFVLLLLLLLLTFGAVFASQIYAVQAFALERQPFSSALGRSVDLLTYRFGRNMLMFMCAGAISGTLSLSYLGTLIGLITWVSLDQSPALRDAATSTVTTLSQVVLLPPLPIWMALLHGRLAQERDAPDLRAAIQQWHATPDGEALIS
jgi:hypothetical protein